MKHSDNKSKKRNLPRPGFGFIVLLITFFFILAGCYDHNEEDLYPQIFKTCDSTDVTYSKTIEPILQTNCYLCHASSIASGGVTLDNYAGVKAEVVNNNLLNAVTHDNIVPPMPLNAAELNDCLIAQIKIWIREGAPDN